MAWLRKSFVEQGVQLVRRQNLPKEALVAAKDAMDGEEVKTCTAVISHGWLRPGHPDPGSHRRQDIKCISTSPFIIFIIKVR